MTIKIEIDKSRKLVITRAVGLLTFKELETRQKALLDEPEFDPSFDHLFDLSGVTSSEEITTSQIEAISRVRIFSTPSRRAIVAPGDLLFGFSRMYEVFSNSTEENYSVFRNPEDAMEWLREKS
jgi:hypothetical protein